RCGEREHVGQKITRRVHDVNLTLAVRNTDVNVQAKDQERASDGLQLLHQQLVSLIIEDLLVLPARDGVRRGGNYLEPILLGQRGNDTTQVRYVSPCFLNVIADPSADFNHRLNHLRLDLLAENHFAFFKK